MKIYKSTLISRVPSVSHQIDGKLFFLKESSDELFELNDTAAYVWKILEKPTTFSSIIDKMLDEFNVKKPSREADLVDLLDLLYKNNVVIYSN